MSATISFDTRESERYIARFTARELDKLMRKVNTAGATAARKVLAAGAPIGTGEREGQFYRANGKGHGTFQASVQSKAIRRRGFQARTIASIIGPMGRWGFTRAWRESGTAPHGGHPGSRGTHYIERVGPLALGQGNRVAEQAWNKYAQAKR